MNVSCSLDVVVRDKVCGRTSNEGDSIISKMKQLLQSFQSMRLYCRISNGFECSKS
jgi:hypothetical protein